MWPQDEKKCSDSNKLDLICTKLEQLIEKLTPKKTRADAINECLDAISLEHEDVKVIISYLKRHNLWRDDRRDDDRRWKKENNFDGKPVVIDLPKVETKEVQKDQTDPAPVVKKKKGASE